MLTILCRNAKVRRTSPRSSAHVRLAAAPQGVDASTITETLGHSTITMTLDTYAHVVQTTLRAAADRMDDALGVDELDEIDGTDTEPDAGA